MPTDENLISEWFDKNKFNHLQLGTVVTSILNFEQFCNLNDDPIPSNFNSGDKGGKKSKWSPLDGRGIPGSKLAQYLTPNPTLPDARGMFIRGLNVLDNNYTAELPIEREILEDNRTVGQYQTDEFKRHNHSSNAISVSGQTFEEGHGNPNYGGANAFINFEGNVNETRPKNIALYYYIRIN
ncbi:MAG: hypothetical protein WC150_10765 [Bacteroidia bacterium]